MAIPPSRLLLMLKQFWWSARKSQRSSFLRHGVGRWTCLGFISMPEVWLWSFKWWGNL